MRVLEDYDLNAVVRFGQAVIYDRDGHRHPTPVAQLKHGQIRLVDTTLLVGADRKWAAAQCRRVCGEKNVVSPIITWGKDL